MAMPPVCDFGWKAPDFSLRATNDEMVSLRDVAGEKGTLVMFICNHCPYVLAILDRLQDDIHKLHAIDVNSVAICANDAVNYPADSFDNMKVMARKRSFAFPYLHDEDQSVARAYDAVCTPDFFGFNANLELQYRGRLDAERLGKPGPDMRRDLVEAMTQIALTGQGPQDQIPSMGCSIKWKAA